LVPVDGNDVKELMEYIRKIDPNQSIHINTGGHGNKKGDMVFVNNDKNRDDITEFIKEDIQTVWKPLNVSIHIASTLSEPIYPDSKANHIIDAWCYSLNNQTVLKKLKETNRLD
jgi:hypothetical protein